MSTDEAQSFLEAGQQSRGYTLEMHRIMAEADLEWAKKYNEFIQATYTGERLLDRKTKELLQVVVEAALRADVEQIQAHVRVGVAGRRKSPGDSGGHAGRHNAHGRPCLPPAGCKLGRRKRGIAASGRRSSYFSHWTLFRSTPMSLISISQTSPSTMFSVAPSVPIHRTSPGIRVR